MHAHLHMGNYHLTTGLSLYILFIAFVLGLVMGSFLNCFAFRYGKGESVLKGRSHCASCGHVLGVMDLIPIFSWIGLRGKCRYCRVKISPVYLLAELGCAVLYLSVVLKFELSPETLFYLVFVSVLFAVSCTDFYVQLIPDRLIVIGIINALVLTVVSSVMNLNNIALALTYTSINGLAVSGPLLLLVLLFDRVLKKESMGGGDIKLMFMTGLYFDWKLNLLLLIIACIFGIIMGSFLKKKGTGEAFAFGPAICLAAWVVMLTGTPLLNWYLGLFM